MITTEKLPDGVLWEKAKEYSKQFSIIDKPVQSEIAMNEAQDHYYRGMIAIRGIIEQQVNELLNPIEKDELLSNLILKSIKLSEKDSYSRQMVRLDKLQELLTNEILK